MRKLVLGPLPIQLTAQLTDASLLFDFQMAAVTFPHLCLAYGPIYVWLMLGCDLFAL